MALVGLMLASYVGYWIAFYTVEPSFHVKAIREASGSYRFEITPNFIVRSICVLSIESPKGVVMENGKQFRKKQTLSVASGLASNDTVTITCGLQYDRIVPSAIRKTKSLVVR